MPPAGFEPAIPARERQQTHTLDRAVFGPILRNLTTFLKLTTILDSEQVDQVPSQQQYRPGTGGGI